MRPKFFEMSDFDSKFMQDDELRSLLRQWSVPDAPGSLDQRVAAAYQQRIGSLAPLSNSALNPQRDNEVVKMKFCDTCQEEFADRFSFCPVDGTPLSAVPATTVNARASEIEASYPVSDTATFQGATAAPFEAPAAATSGQAAMSPKAGLIGEYHLTILEDAGLASRLVSELGGVAHNYQLTWPEFKRDPFGFVKRSFQGYGQMAGRFFARRDAVIGVLISLVAMGALVGMLMLLDRTSAGGSRIGLIVFALGAFAALIAIFATWLGRDSGAAVMGARPSDSRNVLSGIVAAFVIVFGIAGGYMVWAFFHQKALAQAQADDEQLELTQMITDIPNEQPTPDEGTAGMAKGNGGGSKPKQEKAGGGGGGGREEQTDASYGKTPQSDLKIPQVVAPDPHPPVIKNPVLPMPATLDLDPKLNPADQRQLNYGLRESKNTTTPSSGPGTGNGMGNGTGGGMGPGSGGGYGPGEGGNMGGGPRREGGGGPGGGGGGTDYSRTFNPREVSVKARILEKPEPTYTEAARKNQITGTVVIKAVFSSSGQVTNIVAISRLPDGLTEKALAAARQIRFIPAMKDGHPVSMYVQMEYNFNLY
jgi:TonB family protein